MNHYSLENHLKTVCDEFTEYNILKATWDINKKRLPKALTAIGFNFPHYSEHDESHSKTIINNIEMILGEGRIKDLSPTDTWLILMAAYTHDLGMLIYHEILEKKWISDDFQEYLITMKEGYDEDLSKAAMLISDIEDKCKNNKKKINISSLWPLEIKKSVILLVSNYFRTFHAKSSEDMLIDSDIIKLATQDLINERFVKLLGKIVLSHQKDFEFVLNNIEFQTNGYLRDKAHPRFVAELLRIGDLLDLDNGRFNLFIEKAFGGLPKMSETHKKKHASITHFLVTPKVIEIKADCENSAVYRETRNWTNWLKDEVGNLSLHWNEIVPPNFKGGPISIKNNGIKLRIEEKNGQKEQADLRFHISQERAFDIIENANYYDNNLVFLRELFQNSIDAIKLQMWTDINLGYYDGILSKEHNCSKNDILQHLSFPDSIPKEIYSNYFVDIKIRIDETTPDKFIIFEISDNGCGLNNSDVERITNVGNSWKTDKKMKKIINSMPFYLKPTGAFGIGLQSAFIVTDELTIITKSKDENPKRIILFPRKRNGYVTIENLNENDYKRGTSIILKIKEEIRIGSLPIQEFEDYNVFLHEKENIKIFDLVKYLVSVVHNVSFSSNLSLPDSFDISEFRKDINKKLNPDPIIYTESSNKDYRYAIKLDDNNNLVFHIEEKKYGSKVKFIVSTNRYTHFHEFYTFIKSIFLKKGFNGNKFFSTIEWDLFFPDADNCVNYSRTELLPKKRNELYSIFYQEILPSSLRILDEIIEDKVSLSNSNEIPCIIKFNLNILAFIYIDKIIFKNIALDDDFKTNLPFTYNGESKQKNFIDINSFFLKDKIILCNHSFDNELDEIYDELGKYEIEDNPILINNERYSNESKSDPILDSILSYLNTFFILKEIKYLEGNIKILVLEKKQNGNVEIKVKTNKIITNNLLKRIECSIKPSTIYPIDPYCNNLTIRQIPNGFNYSSLDYCNSTGIISPLINEKDSTLISDLFPNKSDIDYEKLKNEISKKIGNFLPNALLKWVSRKNQNPHVTEQDIETSYIELIADILRLKFEVK